MASYEPYLGSIDALGFPWPINGWAIADGSFLPTSQQAALYSLLGTAFGGNGTTTFALPDLRGRGTVGQGAGAGLTPRVIGQVFGQESVTLTVANLPPHEHAVTLGGTAASSGSTAAAGSGSNTPPAIATSAAGGAQPFPTLPPSLVLAFQVALVGYYPSRN